MKRMLNIVITMVCAIQLSWGQMAGETNGRGLSFVPDYQFKGSSLTGWNALGTAEWQAVDGELVGKGHDTSAVGWLMLDRSFQDVTINTLVKINGDGEAGVLFRAEQTESGMKGVLVSLKTDEAAAYGVEIDAQGREKSRTLLRRAGGMMRVAPPPDPNERNTANGQGGGGGQRNAGGQLGPVLPIPRPETAFQANEWNQLECVLDMNILRGFINDGNGPGGAADAEFGNFGPIALYVKGDVEVRYKDFKYKDLALRSTPKEQTSSRFAVQQLSDMYYSFSSAAADFNRDGIMDVVAGPHIYYGPDYTTYREVFQGVTYNPSQQFSEVNCQYAYDFNGDGWTDVFSAAPFGRLYLNPKGESRRWDMHAVIPGNINSEVTVFTDLDGDGRPEIIYGTSGDRLLKYAKFDPADPTKPWKAYLVSDTGYYTAHGFGVGDINGDGRPDITNPNGWWEQPAQLEANSTWTYHPVAFGRYGHRGGGMGGSIMAVYDVNGDGYNDVVTSLNAHGFGLAWYEQQRDEAGEITFQRHLIMDDYSTDNAGGVTFSQLHGTTFADIDGDGISDFIAGKRYWSHLDTHLDPDPNGAAVLYCFRTVRDTRAPGGARFEPELVHNRSGAGSDLLAVDLNGDGKLEIVSSTNRGTFIFWNKSVD
ncbi:FG-GAP-like repeat-containing protein [Parapedobacter koreensis]|uniref:Repeat domain-containing protein n=1 Tax=Parapedobacter koreensis TaxID=332977 RepID=A0A1H7FUS5_9SPHI|nr:FG-GAP-like repeat-containing protein [Parapedobacter koreensis]SEK29846.1 Repeat domain-containing protein [Parapedobacter koreensis]